MTLGHSFAPIRLVLEITKNGWLGVDVFFVLSGFLITRILLDRKHLPASNFFGHFYLSRSLRIFPIYYATILLFLAIPLIFSELKGSGWDRFLSGQGWLWLHGQNALREIYRDQPILEYDWFEFTHFWSLAVEEHFYLAWPFLVYVMSRNQLYGIALILTVVSLCLRAEVLPSGTPIMAAVLSTPKFLSGLAIGGCVAQFLRSNARPSGAVAWLLAVTALATIAGFYSGASGALSKAIASTCASTVTAAIIIATASAPTSPLARGLSARWLVFLGTYSYGLYVYHYLLGPSFRKIPLDRMPGGYTVGMALYIVGYLVAPLGIAVLSFKYIERPIMRWGDRWRHPRSTVSSPQPW